MSRRAWIYILTVLVTASALAVLAALSTVRAEWDWLLFGALLAAASVAQLFEAKHDRQSYYPHFVFFFAAVVLLDPLPLVFVLAIPHLLEWIKDRLTKDDHRKPWYIQPFNIAAHIIPAFAAQGLFFYLIEIGTPLLGAFAPVLSAVTSVCLYVLLNHALVGHVLRVARSVGYAKSGVFSRESLLPDLVMSLLGYVLAVVWSLNPWLALPALSPLLLMYQALKVPQLKQDAQTDSKTGLWNARHFTSLYQAEMERAKRFARPLSLIMADLDLLRNINNTYGHLAGDTVLATIGGILRDNIRDYDVAGRFGGEEFAVYLPETSPEKAREIAERLREVVAATEFKVATSPNPIHITMSFGVASFPEDAFSATDLVHEADVAVYQAKLKGRNCVVSTVEVPHYIKLGVAPVGERLNTSTVPVFVPREIPFNGNGASNGAVHARMPVDVLARKASEPVTTPVSPEAENDSFTAPDAPSSPSLDDTPSAISAQQSALSPQSSKTDEPAEVESSSPKPMSSRLLPFYVAAVSITGLVASVAGTWATPRIDLIAIALLACLTAGAELLQIDAYGDNTVSATVALVFAVTLVGGVPGLAVVSLVITGVHYIRVRPAIYKSSFNWATHLLAGLAPLGVLVALNGILDGVRLDVASLPVLIVPMMVAAVAYFIVETGLVAGAIGLARGANPIEIWRAQFKWLLSHYVVLGLLGVFLGIAYSALGTIGVLVFVLPVLMMRFAQKQYVEKTEDGVHELKRMNEQLRLANEEVVQAHRAMGQFNDELFLTLSKIIDARDPFVGNHAAKVAEYASAIAEKLGLSPERIEPLRQAGFLHDIGKLGISEQILHKPSKLTDEEYEIVKTHAALGGEFLEMCYGLRHLAPLVRHHHERWDGGGYPDGLRGDEISIESRILAVCDSVEAMASDRPYRTGMALHEVIEEVRRCSGTQFDPEIVAIFCSIAERERERFVVNSAMTVLQRQAQKRYGATRRVPSTEPLTSQPPRLNANGATEESPTPPEPALPVSVAS